MIWCDGAADGTQWCGSGVVIQWTGVQECETIATAAGQYGSPYRAEMFAIYKALEVMVEKLTDSAIVIRIHSDSRHALQQLATGPVLQDNRIGFKIWEKLVAISQRNLENVVYLIWVPGHTGVEGNELADQAPKEGGLRDQKEADIDMRSAFRQLRWYTLQEWHREFENMAQSKPAGTADWYLKCCRGTQLKDTSWSFETSTKSNPPTEAQQT